MPTLKPMEINKILDRRIAKRTRNKEYFEYLIKWKGHPIKDSTSINEQELRLHGFDFANIQKNYFVPREFDVGASHPEP